ncbi:aldo/keto reductase [Parabacteroides sp. OttesenSCG-928-N08]|nr:aldo/keto reductase [Parabacteroides sp. OttesenSCG-928-N08]
MSKMNRRRFLQSGIAGMAGLTAMASHLPDLERMVPTDATAMVDAVTLGNSGLKVSRIAMGSGTIGGNKESNQTRLGIDAFTKLARHGYDRGIRFFEMADSYGSQPYFGKALQGLPRENFTLMTKMWTHADDSDRLESVEENLDRFRLEMKTDYIDILLMHCMTNGEWANNRKHYMEGFTKAKEAGIVKAVGVSCHNWEAMVEASQNPWVDVMLVRINPFQTHMDGTPEAVSELIGKARANGKGVIGMKIFGEGRNVSDTEREQSIRYAMTTSQVNCITLGLESTAQMDDAIERVMRNRKQ